MSCAGQYSSVKVEGNRRIEHKIDRLEDLVWKLYEELDNKIQDVFEEHTNKFKQQNDIISNIFHGFGQEIGMMKEELEMQKQNEEDYKITDPKLYTQEEHESFEQDTTEEEHKCKH